MAYVLVSLSKQRIYYKTILVSVVLGVGCMVAEKHGIEINRNYLGYVDGGTLSNQRAVQEWLGLRNPHGYSSLCTESMPKLTALNDKFGRSFIEIADHLEANAELYFKESK